MNNRFWKFETWKTLEKSIKCLYFVISFFVLLMRYSVPLPRFCLRYQDYVFYFGIRLLGNWSIVNWIVNTNIMYLMFCFTQNLKDVVSVIWSSIVCTKTNLKSFFFFFNPADSRRLFLDHYKYFNCRTFLVKVKESFMDNKKLKVKGLVNTSLLLLFFIFV